MIYNTNKIKQILIDKQLESLTNELHELEKTLNQLKEEKNQFIQTKIDADQDNERQNLVRQITQEKVRK